MIIKTSADLSGVHPRALPKVSAYVADESHLVSLSADISQSATPNASAAPATPVAPGVALAPAALTPEQQDKIQKALIKFASSNFGHLRAYVPEAGKGIDVLELVFASKYAADALRDPARTSIAGPLVKTARAMSELVDLVKPFVPALDDNPYVEAATVIIKFGDSIYQVHADVTAIVAAAPSISTPLAPQ